MYISNDYIKKIIVDKLLKENISNKEESNICFRKKNHFF